MKQPRHTDLSPDPPAIAATGRAAPVGRSEPSSARWRGRDRRRRRVDTFTHIIHDGGANGPPPRRDEIPDAQDGAIVTDVRAVDIIAGDVGAREHARDIERPSRAPGQAARRRQPAHVGETGRVRTLAGHPTQPREDLARRERSRHRPSNR